MAAAPRRLACVRPRPCTSPSWAVRRPAGRKGGPHRGDDQRRHTHGRRRPAGGAGAAHQVPAPGREGGSGPAARQALGGPPAPRARARPGTPRRRRAGAPAPRPRRSCLGCGKRLGAHAGCAQPCVEELTKKHGAQVPFAHSGRPESCRAHGRKPLPTGRQGGSCVRQRDVTLQSP